MGERIRDKEKNEKFKNLLKLNFTAIIIIIIALALMTYIYIDLNTFIQKIKISNIEIYYDIYLNAKISLLNILITILSLYLTITFATRHIAYGENIRIINELQPFLSLSLDINNSTKNNLIYKIKCLNKNFATHIRIHDLAGTNKDKNIIDILGEKEDELPIITDDSLYYNTKGNNKYMRLNYKDIMGTEYKIIFKLNIITKKNSTEIDDFVIKIITEFEMGKDLNQNNN